MKRKSSKPLVEPPLQIHRFTQVDPETGARVKVTRMQRGILRREERTFDSQSMLSWAKQVSSWSPKKYLEGEREQLRNQLERAGIPSDRQYAWIKRPGSDWEPQVGPVKEFKAPCAFANWYSRMKDLTEPLSKIRQVGEALWDLDHLLRQPGIDKHLWHIVQFHSSFSTLRIAGATNVMATSGMAARKARSLGPAAKSAKAAKRCEVIEDLAARLRVNEPRYKSDASNTAARIANDVNRALAERNLLPVGSDRISVKTIADQLRKSNGGKRLRTG